MQGSVKMREPRVPVESDRKVQTPYQRQVLFKLSERLYPAQTSLIYGSGDSPGLRRGGRTRVRLALAC